MLSTSFRSGCGGKHCRLRNDTSRGLDGDIVIDGDKTSIETGASAGSAAEPLVKIAFHRKRHFFLDLESARLKKRLAAPG